MPKRVWAATAWPAHVPPPSEDDGVPPADAGVGARGITHALTSTGDERAIQATLVRLDRERAARSARLREARDAGGAAGDDALRAEWDALIARVAHELEALIEKTDGFCIGAPTLGGHMPTPVSNALGVIVKESTREYPAGVFGSFGWSGEAVDLMEARLKDGGFDFAFAPIRCKFKPTQETLQICEESGTDLAQSVKKVRRKKQSDKTKQVSAGSSFGQSDTAAAVGRIVGSLCAVTAKKDDAQSAVLASWVSQASFNPPALTVAVAKERAVESFLLKGSVFNLNVLQGGNEKETMKSLLKPFKPGEDRFGDMEVKISETNGCAIVTEALSYLECEVSERMECGDHWVVLATVRDGKLLQEDGLTAIHHRKTGTSY